MPTYVYRCTKCGHEFELFHSISDDKPKRCPKCRSKAVRVPAGSVGLLFKGSGFYITDYRSKSYRDKAKQEKGGAPASGSGGSSGSGDASGSGGSSGSSGSSGTGGTSGAGGGSGPGKATGSGGSGEKRKKHRASD